jgi:hypothetical protein
MRPDHFPVEGREARRGRSRRGRAREASLVAAALLAAGVAIAEHSAQAAPAPDAPIVEVYTMDQGAILVERFGHAAICVRYRDSRRDRCYNYGTTRFEDPVGLGWGFLRGRSMFWVSVQTPKAMLDHYRDNDRTIWRQRIPLSPAAAIDLAQQLAEDAKPENKYYTYHHFEENCSTRVRDFVDAATRGALSVDPRPGDGDTYRELTRIGLAEEPLVLLISDVVLGRPLDREPNSWQLGFLPRYLRADIERRLGATPELIYQREGGAFDQDPGSGGRWWLVVVALVFTLPAALARWRGRWTRLTMAISLMPAWMITLVVWALAIVSTMPELRQNEALLLFLPSDPLLPFLSDGRRRLYARSRLAMLLVIALLMLFGVFTQSLWVVMVVIAVPLAVAAV